MKIESVHIKNFCSILDETLVCSDLTALVGANGSGKSSFLKAIKIFYDSSAKVSIEDFYNKNTDNPISITITYNTLSASAESFFASYIQDGKLTVEFIIEWGGDRPSVPRYFGSSLQNPEFAKIRSIEGATSKRSEYTKLKSSDPDYSALPSVRNQGELDQAMKAWEENHPEQNKRIKDEGQFFGFKGVARGYLGRYSQFVYIPAVQNAPDVSEDGKNSPFTTLMDLVVRSVLSGKTEVTQLKKDTQSKYDEILDPKNHPELQTLSDYMTGTLNTFVAGAKVDLQWLGLGTIEIPMPQAKISLNEDGFGASVEKAGHGLQRAFLMTLFQHLAMAQATKKDEGKKDEDAEPSDDQGDQQETNLLVAIEEPELYQHPARQRHFASILGKLAANEIPGVARSTQIIYGTHSPYFVGLDRFNKIRLLRKETNPEQDNSPKISKIYSTNLEEIANQLWENDGKSGSVYTEATLLPRLKSIMTPWMNEGFFANAVVLVEGEDDRAIILGVASSLGIDLESKEIAIIPCNGKASIDRPYVIFSKLGVPVYLVWDGDGDEGETEGACSKCGKSLDSKPNPEDNKRLLRLVGVQEVDWPECVESNHACFRKNLETTLKEEIGADIFQECLNACKEKYLIAKDKNALKNPTVIAEVIEMARVRGSKSETIEKIIASIQEIL